MQIHFGIHNLPKFQSPILTIGTFDGVHKGHKVLLYQLKTLAKASDSETIVVTFHPHPRTVISDSNDLKMITTMEERITLLKGLEINHLVIIPFNENFSNIEASQFITDFLVKCFSPHTIVLGYDHRFGKNREGNFDLMKKYSANYGFQIFEIPESILNNITISSTKIRECIRMGEMQLAADYLGYHFPLEGKVVEGNKLGRTIGFPTANLSILNPDKLLPMQGVYAVKTNSPNDENSSLSLEGMMNIGYRPTVDGKKLTVEVNIFDFDEDIYGKILQVQVFTRIRSEEKFSGLAALKDQLAKDKLAAKNYFLLLK